MSFVIRLLSVRRWDQDAGTDTFSALARLTCCVTDLSASLTVSAPTPARAVALLQFGHPSSAWPVHLFAS